MRTRWHMEELYLVAANIADQDGQLFFRDGYAIGWQLSTSRASVANRFLALFRASGFEDAPRTILVLWRELIDPSGAVLPHREVVYRTPGMAALPVVPASSVTGKYVAPAWVPS